jgi:D-alanine-D-alanine ligase
MTPIGRLRVAMLVDREVVAGGRIRSDATDRHVFASLRRQAAHVALAPFTSAAALFRFLDAERPDVVFNLTEHVGGNRLLDAHVCALLELRGVPYTGAGPKGLTLCRDKALSKLVAARAGFRTPWFFVADDPIPDDVPFPLIVKPRLGDSSEFVNQASLVTSRRALAQRIAFLRRRKVADIICEEFVGGREMVVGHFCGRTLPPRELVVGRAGSEATRIFSARLKHLPAHRRRWDVRMGAARLTSSEFGRLEDAVRRTAAALHLRDYGRIDFKLTGGEFVFMEANPNPPLVPSRGSFAKTWSGENFDALVARITCEAAERGWRAEQSRVSGTRS